VAPSPADPAGSYAVFLDFDGTLVDIAATPDAVAVDPALPSVVERLRARLRGALAVVTGRPLRDIDRFLPGLNFDGCGMHGLERRVNGRTSMSDLPDQSGEIDQLRSRLAPWPGLLVENKRIGVAVHWRQQPEAEGEARAGIDALAARLGPAYRIQDGKAVREIVPGQADKGEGIRALMSASPYKGRLPIFAGDDRTDEHGFAAAAELGGITLKVGPGPTAASYRVASPAELRATLARWAEEGPSSAGLEAA
jgi:trehalose 6-phosphate phosphatase